MMLRTLLVAPLLGIVLPAVEPLPADAAERPNVLLFLVDDLGWQDTSVPFHTEATHWNRRYRTPNMQRLAREGLQLTNGYASAPVCTPTRTSILTGRSPARSHITYWTLYADRDQSADFPSVRAPEWNWNGLAEGDVTLPRLLSAAGYRTIHAGKAHFGAKGTSGEDPARLGFDVNIAGHAPGGPGSFYGLHGFGAKQRQGQEGTSVWDVPGLEDYHGHDVYLTEAIALEACRALRTAVAAEQPFFLNFAPYAVHAPIMANRKYLASYSDLDEREAAYATMIETVDRALGAILFTLEELGVLDDTLIVFTSDNGGLSAHARGGEAHTHNSPLRSGKGSSYEGGVRVPWIVRWPGVVEAGRVSTTPVISHDLFPTLLAAAGVAVPDAHSASVDGRDLGGLLRGEEPPVERALLWHMPHFWGVRGPGIEPYSALRKGPWKLLYYHGDRRLELYDLEADIGEQQDLAASEPEALERLARELSDLLASRGARMSVDKESGEAVALPRAGEAR